MKTAIAAAPCAVLDQRSGFTKRIDALRQELEATWAATPCELPAIGPRTGFLWQCSNARAAARLIDDLAVEIERVPDGERERLAWRETGRERLHPFGQAGARGAGGHRGVVC